ncbi:MAG: tRNA lysidine(34) synthetase TilS [Cyanobacteria bacterium PR.3.49]|nr:tRNA lysidine(34) synthetase TilS [Cyanobacteria bacterium PR.3.49]
MDTHQPQFLGNEKLAEASRLAVSNCRKRLLIADHLQSFAAELPEDGFFSWAAVEQFLLVQGVKIPDQEYSLPLKPIMRTGADNPLIIGISGGADSVCLFTLSLWSKLSGIFSPIVGCHVNHRMRGVESDEDAQFCENLVKQLNAKFVLTVASQAQAEAFKLRGAEGELRNFRYDAFETQAGVVGARVVALAHTLNDQVETLLFRAFRGTSATGLRGIPCVRRHKNFVLVRPLIDVPRPVIESLLLAKSFAWRDDSSNNQIRYKRNFIRSEIVPRIESEFPQFDERLENMRKLIADDEDLLKTLTNSQISEVERKGADTWDLCKLQELPVALKRRMLAQALKERNVELSYERLEKLVLMTVSDADLRDGEEVPSAVSLNQHWDIVRSKEQLIFVDKTEDEDQPPADPIPVRVPGMTLIPALNKALFVEAFDPREKLPKAFPPADSLEPFVSLEKVKGALEIRERQPGDCIQPFGMQEMVKLKKYLHTHKPDEELPAQGRQKLHVLACGEEVLWVPGVGLSEKLRVNGRPTHVIKLLDIAIGESTFC